jgi:hypothetical protein
VKFGGVVGAGPNAVGCPKGDAFEAARLPACGHGPTHPVLADKCKGRAAGTGLSVIDSASRERCRRFIRSLMLDPPGHARNENPRRFRICKDPALGLGVPAAPDCPSVGAQPTFVRRLPPGKILS